MAIVHLNGGSTILNGGRNFFGDYPDGVVWREASTLPVAISDHTSIVYDGKIWIIGGIIALTPNSWTTSKKVYCSTDGIVWTELGAGSGTLPVETYYHTSVVFNDEMWLIGGLADGNYTSKIYSSTDGIVWTEVGEDVLPEITRHTSVVFDGKMWLIGGFYYGSTHKVYSSEDGEIWEESGDDVLPIGVYDHTSVVFNDKMWIIGGDGSNKVYHSNNGTSWTEAATLEATIEKHSSVVFNDKMWIIGGVASGRSRDVYSSSDGTVWSKMDASVFTLPLKISNHTSVVFNDKMWIIGGIGESGNSNKVYWSLR